MEKEKPIFLYEGEKSHDRRTIEYRSWEGMRQRCYNPKNASFKNYGGRGIIVCTRWLVYENFLTDMGRKPTEKYQLGRIDNNKGYFPANCRWETAPQQGQNRRSNAVNKEDVRRIRKLHWRLSVPVKKIAKEFSISRTQVYRIISYENW